MAEERPTAAGLRWYHAADPQPVGAMAGILVALITYFRRRGWL